MNSPKYFEIYKKIKDNLDRGVWQPAQKLPPERELAYRYQVSRETLRKAISRLVNERNLVKQVGSGTFVSQPKFKIKFSNQMAFNRNFGIERVISKQIQNKFESIFEKPTLKIVSAISNGNSLSFLREVSVPTNLISDFSIETGFELHQTLQKRNLISQKVNQVFSVSKVNPEIADYLKIDGNSPILCSEQASGTESGVLTEWVRCQYSRYFEFDLNS